MNLLNEGGPIFMYPLLLLLVLVLVLLVKGFIKKEYSAKAINLVRSITLFAIVWGALGQILGLISAFDSIQAAGNVSFGILAGGLKISFLSTAFGAVIFLVGRLGIIILTLVQKD